MLFLEGALAPAAKLVQKPHPQGQCFCKEPFTVSRSSSHLGTDGTSFQFPSTAPHIQPEFGLNLPVPSSSWSTPASSPPCLDPCNGPLAAVCSSPLFCPSGESGVVGLIPQLLGQSGRLWNGSRILVSGQHFFLYSELFQPLAHSSHWVVWTSFSPFELLLPLPSQDLCTCSCLSLESSLL